MLNQKTLRKQKKHSERLLLGPPKIRRIRKPKKPWENPKKLKNKKNNSGEVLRKRGSSQESLRIVFFVFLFFFGFPKVFCFFCFSDFGGPAKSLPELFFFVFCFLKALLVLFWFLSFMHIYQCFLVLIVALMHLPNIYEHLWKTKTQAPWPPLLYIYMLFPLSKLATGLGGLYQSFCSG